MMAPLVLLDGAPELAAISVKVRGKLESILAVGI